MKRTYWSLLTASLIIAIAVAGCGSPGLTSSTPTQRPAVSAGTQAASTGLVSASVVVEPAQTSDMAFLIAARVKAIQVKEGEQVKAGQTLIVLDTPNLDYALAAAQAELKSAQANVLIQSTRRKTTLLDKIYYLSGPPEIRNKARARALQAQASLEVAQANLAQGTLVAPFDGTVVSINAVPGEMVESNKTVVVIGDLEHLQLATTDLSEREIANVHPGQTAITRLKAFDQNLTGEVVAISPLSEESNGDTVFKVTVALDQPPKGLLWGMTGDITIQAK